MHDDMGAWRVRGPRDPHSGEPRSCVEAVWAEVVRTATAGAEPRIPEQSACSPFCLDVPDDGEPAHLDGAGEECWAGAIKGDPGFFDGDLWGVVLPAAGEREH
ncbi:hypothetical protein OOZ19_19325 [Saccharopolyspora sp. NFXS83]|uniref:hypothetical protein n=1 Tax=Saccharopolyspora sp. NFXS83 TaxID=2993560 RepID=UPI00224AD823|nr:hypothetical protein [Saccharopolyspora sp. NFXS83]MCX2732396.1 hypothetical protein [Saccharopolyspora sp. NFXS83]